MTISLNLKDPIKHTIGIWTHPHFTVKWHIIYQHSNTAAAMKLLHRSSGRISQHHNYFHPSYPSMLPSNISVPKFIVVIFTVLKTPVPLSVHANFSPLDWPQWFISGMRELMFVIYCKNHESRTKIQVLTENMKKAMWKHNGHSCCCLHNVFIYSLIFIWVPVSFHKVVASLQLHKMKSRQFKITL